MKRIAVFASGSGSNFEALVKASQNGDIPVPVVLLITDNPEAQAIVRAKRLGVPWAAFRPKDYESKADYECALRDCLERYEVDFAVLAGYMRIVGPTLLSVFKGRMINIHPSLLPSFPGKDAIGQALEHGAKVTGVTVHYVDEGIDTGPIIAQVPVIIRPGEVRESLETRIHKVEHRLLVRVVQSLAGSDVNFGKEQGGEPFAACTN